jgi:hypothetical protein
MSAHMATATCLDTGQALAYLFVFLLPLLIHYLASYLLEMSPTDRWATAKLFYPTSSWPPGEVALTISRLQRPSPPSSMHGGSSTHRECEA